MLRKNKNNNKNDNSEPVKYGALRWSFAILVLVVWALGLGLISLRFATIDYGLEVFTSYVERPAVIVLNLLPVLMLTLALFLLTNRVWSAAFLSGAVVILLSIVNYFKILLRSDPLIASDLALFFEAANIGMQYMMSMTRGMKLSLVAVPAGAAVFALLVRAHFTGVNGLRARIAIGSALVVIWVMCWSQWYTDLTLYTELSIVDIELEERTLERWSTTDSYVMNGFVYPLLYSVRDIKISRPVGYSEAETARLYATYAYDDIPEDKKVSVISVMLEAFTDFSDFKNIDRFETDPLEFWHELELESVHGRLVTNIFAGNTVDTERGFISGLTDGYNFRAPTASYARYFKDQGYFTEFCHPGHDWFYNRRNVMEHYMGFDAVWFYESRYPPTHEDWPIRDDMFLPDIAYLFKEAVARDELYFNFSVTYQNHGPYSMTRSDTMTEYLRNYGFSQISYTALNNYFYGLSLTDRAIREFIGYLAEMDEPVIVVLFGDHRPWMGDNAAVYYELDLNIALDDEEGFYNYFSTPYIIWANAAAKETLGNDFVGEGGDFSPAFLMTRVFDLAGWGGDEFVKISRELQESIDVVNTMTGLVRENGVLTDTLTPEGSAAFAKYKRLEYYRRMLR